MVGTKHRNGTLSGDELCSITGLTDSRHRQLAQAGCFPLPIRGRWQTHKTLVGIIKWQRELLSKKNGDLAQEQLALTTTKRLAAQEDLARARGKYVLKAEIGPALRNISLHQRATLQRKLEQELGPNLAGQTTLEILPKMKAAVDEVCQIFKEGIASWLEAP